MCLVLVYRTNIILLISVNISKIITVTFCSKKHIWTLPLYFSKPILKDMHVTQLHISQIYLPPSNANFLNIWQIETKQSKKVKYKALYRSVQSVEINLIHIIRRDVILCLRIDFQQNLMNIYIFIDIHNMTQYLQFNLSRVPFNLFLLEKPWVSYQGFSVSELDYLWYKTHLLLTANR